MPPPDAIGGTTRVRALAFVVHKPNLNSIAALTGALENDPRTSGLRLHFVWHDDRTTHRLCTLARQVDHLAVGLSLATADLPAASRLLAELGEADARSRLTILAGGPHPSAEPGAVLRLGADAVAVGEGEATLPALLDCWQRDEPLAGLPGVVTLDPDGHLDRGPRPRPIDLDDFPPLGIRHRRFGPIEITRGCPSACAFCQTTFLFGSRMRHRSVEPTVEWVRQAMAHGYNYLRFVTPNAFAYGAGPGQAPNLDALEHLLGAMAALVGRERVYFGTFPSEVSPETVTPEAVALVRRYCGNTQLLFGAQSGSPRLLQSLRRSHTLHDIYRAAHIIRDAGLTPIADVIFGLPGETADDLEATVTLMTDLTAQGAVIHALTCMPLPGTPLADAPPGQVDPALHAWLDRLASQGQLMGQWRRQQEIAAR
jgi:B12-binding domain/radical SAM domain protein